MKQGLIKKGYDHEYGQAGMKIMTLGLKLKIELMLKDQTLDDFLKEVHIGRNTFNQVWTQVPNDKIYFTIAEYFGLDIDELRKLPITRDEILNATPEELEARDKSAYDVIEEAYFSEWFMTDAIEQTRQDVKEQKAKQAEEIKELKNLIKETRESQTLEGISDVEQMLLRRKFNFKSKSETEDTESTETSESEVYNEYSESEHNDYGYTPYNDGGWQQ